VKLHLSNIARWSGRSTPAASCYRIKQRDRWLAATTALSAVDFYKTQQLECSDRGKAPQR
jgi:hypothetical protein